MFKIFLLKGREKPIAMKKKKRKKKKKKRKKLGWMFDNI